MSLGASIPRVIVATGLVVAGLAGRTLAQNEAAVKRSAADILAAGDDLRVPASRERVVGEIRRGEDERRAVAVERARLRGLPARIVLPDGSARELVRWDGEQPFYYTTFNANAAISTGGNVLRLAPYLANGTNGTVGVWDGGAVRPTHQEFGGRVTVKDGAANYYHATHVGGTIGASGVDASARGMATAVAIDSYDWNNDISEMTSRGAATAGEVGKINISNHSYGGVSGWTVTGLSSPAWEWYGSGTTAAGYEDDFGRYNTDARSVDSLAYSLPYYLMFWAAGNERSNNPVAGAKITLTPGGTTVVDYSVSLHPPGDGVYRGGYDTISYMPLAKNVVTVGAVNDAVAGGVRTLANATLTSFTSWGPTDDGRIKPDVVANGASLYSTLETSDTAYGWMSGTSMATPNAVGTAQQLVYYYGTQFPGQVMRASTLKGLLIHTADDLGVAGPDYAFGWGLINGKGAADLIAAAHTNAAAPRLIEQQLTTTTITRTHSFTWDGVSPIRATLCWTDPAGASTTTHDLRLARLVNNLNLRIVGPTGTTHLPWVMPFVGNWATNAYATAAVFGTNNTDNVEQVYIATPSAAGTYDAVVSFSGVLTGSPQYYSLLLSGTGTTPPSVNLVTPDSGETGLVSLTVQGSAFATGAAVTFVRAGQVSVSASVSSVVQDAISCSVDVSSMLAGVWDVRVDNPDGTSGTLSAGFTVLGTLWSQGFDPTAPGWTASANIGSTYWKLTNSASHTPSNSYFAPGPTSKNTDNLVSESIAIPAMAQRLRLHFWHKYGFDTNYDGGVLEFSIDGGTYFDVTASGSGAAFVVGGYTATLFSRTGSTAKNELTGRTAWTGNSGSGFVEVIVALTDTAKYAGKSLRARWRLGTDGKTASSGWYVDSVRLSGYDTANHAPSIVTAATAAPTVVSGVSTALSVTASDDGGEASLVYTWTANAPPDHPVVYSRNGTNAARTTTATFSQSGTYGFVVTARDVEGLTATSSVSVAVQATPTSLVVAPPSAEVVAGQAQSFVATARDQFGLALATQPVVSWSVTGGGAITTGGVFTAGMVAGGPFAITASAAGLTGGAQVTVVPPPPVYFILSVVASPAAGGSVTGAGVFESGTLAPISATVSNGWRFTGWSGTGITSPSSATTTVRTDADKTVTALFTAIPRTTLIVVR